MISFSCPKCGRSFAVPDAAAGRRARCNGCQSEMIVPAQSVRQAAVVAPSELPAITTESPKKMAPRTRRLLAEHEQMRRVFNDSDVVRILIASGEPPEAYEIEYHIKSLAPGEGADAEPVERETHRVRIELTPDYPRLSPRCKMLTPIFHPNFDEATICVGDHWTAGERLVDLVVRIGEMISFQAYNIKSPLNGEAAMWADLHGNAFPTDARPMRPAAMD